MMTSVSSDISRFTDLNEESVSQMPTPIFGYENESILSLEESIKPVEHLFEKIEINVLIAKENSKELKEGLTQDESAAIRLYTMSFSDGRSLYQILNKTLRSEKREDLKIWFKYLKLFLKGLEKLPSRSETVWRGIGNVDLTGQYPNGKVGAWWGLSSCTSSLDVLQSNKFLGKTGTRTLFSIECRNGKSIKQYSRYTSEEEIILMPGFYFQVKIQVSPAEGLTIIHLKEIHPPYLSIPVSPSNNLDQLKIGEKSTFEITGSNKGSVWGANIYKIDSDVSTAAVHAEIIRLGETKTIRIKIIRGQSNYESNTQNNITSLAFGSWGKSYFFLTDINDDDDNPPVVAPINLESYRSKVGQILSLIVTGTFGTNVYTDDSNIGAASVHAGIINIGQTKPVRVKILPELTISNNITDFPIFSGQSSITIFYKTNNPNPPGPMCGSTDDNDYLLLFYSIPFISLILYKGNQFKSMATMNNNVIDICWSQSTQSFIIASSYLYEFNPLNGILSQPCGNQEFNRNCWTIDCDLNDLFVVYYPDMSLCRRDINKPFNIKEEWSRNTIMCEQGDQIIGSIRIDQDKHILGLTIKQIDNRWRVDLFETTNMQRLYHGETFADPAIPNKFYCMVIPLLNNYNQWLVVNDTNQSQSQMILIDEKGRTINEKTCDAINVTLIGKDKITFLTQGGVTVCPRKI